MHVRSFIQSTSPPRRPLAQAHDQDKWRKDRKWSISKISNATVKEQERVFMFEEMKSAEPAEN